MLLLVFRFSSVKFIQMRKIILENGDVLLALAELQNRQIEFENETNKKFDEILK